MEFYLVYKGHAGTYVVVNMFCRAYNMQNANCAVSIRVLECSISQQAYLVFSHNATQKPENSMDLMAFVCCLFVCFVVL
jgi:hypothetical protein